MRKICLIPLLLLVSLPATAERGFLRSDSPHLAAPMKDASRAIFRILVPGDDFLSLPLSAVPKAIEERLVSDKKLRKELPWTVQQLRFCLLTAMDPCLFTESYRQAFSGTAFIAGQGNLVWTAGHNLIRYYRALLEHKVSFQGRPAESLGRLPVFFRLEGMDGLVHFHRYYSTDTDGVAYLVSDLKKYQERDFPVRGRTVSVAAPLTNDLAILETEKPFPYYLSFAPAPSSGRKFLGGFPKSSVGSGRENGLKGESNGDVQYFSDGFEFSCRDELEKNVDDDHREAITALIQLDAQESLICSDVDALPGNSGGPLLNERGEVDGMVVVAWPHQGEARTLFLSNKALFRQLPSFGYKNNLTRY